jgi:putative DNA primase/helicase
VTASSNVINLSSPHADRRMQSYEDCEYQRGRIAELIGRGRAQDRMTTNDPFAAACYFCATHYSVGDLLTLLRYQDEFYRYNGRHYVPTSEADIRAAIWDCLNEPSESPPDPKAKKPRKKDVDDIVDALRAITNVSNSIALPTWHPAGLEDPDPLLVIPTRNGLLDVPTNALLEPTPRFVVSYSLPFDFDAHAPPPTMFLDFLNSILGDDSESIALLQEFIGYLLTPDTRQQKALLLVGPKRAGKGTLVRIIQRLLGPDNYCSPSLSSLGQPFGLQTLIGKNLAVFSDARISGRTDTLIENLLRITGEDAVSVSRKYKADYTARMTAKIMLVSNELPRLADSSGALASRFILIRLRHSFFGREDHNLEQKLSAELPSILNWALIGLDRLTARGHFVQPQASREVLEEFEQLSSPITKFINDELVLDVDGETPKQAIFERYKAWAKANGYERHSPLIDFCRDLLAAIPTLETSRPRTAPAPAGAPDYQAPATRQRCFRGVRLRECDSADFGLQP